MESIVTWLGIIIGSIICLLFILFLGIKGMVKLYDILAEKKAFKYCQENDLEFIEAKAFPNHYGLYFKKEGKRFYASYNFEANRSITWKKGNPLEIAAKKLNA